MMIHRSPLEDVQIPDTPLTDHVLELAGGLGAKPALIDGPTGRFVKHVTAADPLLGPSGELSPILLIEAMAQGAGIVLGRQEPELRERGAVLAAIDHCAIAGSAAIGDALEIEITVVRRYAGMARIKARACVGARTCATASLTLAFPPGSSAASE